MHNYWLEFKAWDMGFDAHLTLHWMGKCEGTQTFPIRKWLAETQVGTYTTYVKPTGIEIFGSDNEVAVVTVDTFPDITEMKNQVEELFPSPSEFSFRPHITLKGIGFNSITIPPIIKLSGLTIKSDHDPF